MIWYSMRCFLLRTWNGVLFVYIHFNMSSNLKTPPGNIECDLFSQMSSVLTEKNSQTNDNVSLDLQTTLNSTMEE